MTLRTMGRGMEAADMQLQTTMSETEVKRQRTLPRSTISHIRLEVGATTMTEGCPTEIEATRAEDEEAEEAGVEAEVTRGVVLGKMIVTSEGEVGETIGDTPITMIEM